MKENDKKKLAKGFIISWCEGAMLLHYDTDCQWPLALRASLRRRRSGALALALAASESDCNRRDCRRGRQ